MPEDDIGATIYQAMGERNVRPLWSVAPVWAPMCGHDYQFDVALRHTNCVEQMLGAVVLEVETPKSRAISSFSQVHYRPRRRPRRPVERSTIERLYADLASYNCSSELLQKCPVNLAVLP